MRQIVNQRLVVRYVKFSRRINAVDTEFYISDCSVYKSVQHYVTLESLINNHVNANVDEAFFIL